MVDKTIVVVVLSCTHLVMHGKEDVALRLGGNLHSSLSSFLYSDGMNLN